MNTPPSSTTLPFSSSSAAVPNRPHPTPTSCRDEAMASPPSSGPPRVGPPSPTASSSASSAIAVGSGNEEAMYAQVGVPQSRSRAEAGAGARADPNHDSVGADSGFGVSATAAGDVADAGMEIDQYVIDGYPESITSSVRQHIFEGGLRYHAFRDGKYAFPNDDIEQNRDDMKHTMTVMLMKGKYFAAPVEDVFRNGGNVIDLGTGTGIWCTQLGDKYPNCNIEGVDLSPIQPSYVPQNVYFYVDDIEDDWLYPENHFDYIHIRHTLHSIRDQRTLIERIYRHLKPGGYLEIQELHYSPHCDDRSVTVETPYAFRDFMNYLHLGMQALGTDLHSILAIPGLLRQVGFTGVTRQTQKCPIGVWPRDRDLRYCGLFMRTAIMDGLRGLSKRPFGTGLGWTQLQIEMFLVDVRKAVMDNNRHTYFPFHTVYGRKPI